ncbi:hypothetical protein [Kitasatospora sp. MAP12-44]|uniref:hypothetical protein n=1 Tax=unclassified Kitasatospora TaxID=2633591 RepID=UPI002473C543|nr:hypothetical protein [Kitasatospora sp. MAP12-44]MDH6111301.1 hypothetical protein [Kitasatospora sp. MAP12-44]
MATDQTTVLGILAPLADGTTAGHQQVARRDDLLITAQLANGRHAETYRGVHVRVVLRPSGVELGANTFDFDSYRTIPQRSPGQMHSDLDRLAELNRSGRLQPGPIREAIGEYLALFADTTPQPAAARSRVRINSRAQSARTSSATTSTTAQTAPITPAVTAASLPPAARRGSRT